MSHCHRYHAYAYCLRFEEIERRRLLAAWQNSGNPFDVNDDLSIGPLDVMVVINRLSASQFELGSRPFFELGNFVDVNGDGIVSPLDAISIINSLASPAITARLVTDTAPGDQRNSDGITFLADVEGRILFAERVDAIFARVGSPSSHFTDITDRLHDGGFYLDMESLTAIAGQAFADGDYVLELRATFDGNEVATTLPFQLDTQRPALTQPPSIHQASMRTAMGLEYDEVLMLRESSLAETLVLGTVDGVDDVIGVPVGPIAMISEAALDVTLDPVPLPGQYKYQILSGVFDIAGNLPRIEAVPFEIREMSSEATIVSTSPKPHGISGQDLRSAVIRFSQELDLSSASREGIRLLSEEGVEIPIDFYDAPDRRDLIVGFSQLPLGKYRVEISPFGLRDRGGNFIAATTPLSFSVVDAEFTWKSPDGGFWEDARNWNPPRVPDATSSVVISGMNSGAAIRGGKGGTAVQRMFIDGLVTLTQGVWQVVDGIQIAGKLTFAQGEMRATTLHAMKPSAQFLIGKSKDVLLSNVTFDVDTIVPARARVKIVPGIMLRDGHELSMHGSEAGASTILLERRATIAGEGTVVFHGSGDRNNIISDFPGSLTIESGITVTSGASGGRIGADSFPLRNSGTIRSATEGAYITLYSIRNSGELIMRDGGSIEFAGSTVSRDLGGFQAQGPGRVRVTGEFDNHDAILNLGNARWTFDNALIRGGTMTSTTTIPIVVDAGAANEWRGVTFDVDVVLSLNAQVDVIEHVTLVHDHQVTMRGAVLRFRGDGVTLRGQGAVLLEGNGRENTFLGPLGGTWMIDEGITIATSEGNGVIGQTNTETVNRGELVSGLPDWHLTLIDVHNEGTITVVNGGTLEFGGDIQTAELQQINLQDASEIRIIGNLHNIGEVLDLSTSRWVLHGGGVIGGRITSSEGKSLLLRENKSLTNRLRNVILDVDVEFESRARLHVSGGLRFENDHRIVIEGATPYPASIVFDGDQTLRGTGGIVLVGEDRGAASYSAPRIESRNGTLTIGTSIWVDAGQFGGSIVGVDEAILNHGTIRSSGADVYLTLANVQNLGRVLVPDGASLTLLGDFPTANLSAMTAIGTGSLFIEGTLDNHDSTLWVDGLQWGLRGTIIGGAIASREGRSLRIESPNAQFMQYVQVATDITLVAGATLTVRHGLVFDNNAALRMQASTTQHARLHFVGAQTVTGNGTIVLEGAGNLTNRIAKIDSGDLELDEGITIRTATAGGVIEGKSASIIHRGSLVASGQYLKVKLQEVVVSGRIEARDRGTVIFGGANSLTASSEIDASSNGRIVVQGRLNNSENELTIRGSGWSFDGGVIDGGTVVGPMNLPIVARGDETWSLQRVRLGSDLTLPPGSTLELIERIVLAEGTVIRLAGVSDRPVSVIGIGARIEGEGVISFEGTESDVVRGSSWQEGLFIGENITISNDFGGGTLGVISDYTIVNEGLIRIANPNAPLNLYGVATTGTVVIGDGVQQITRRYAALGGTLEIGVGASVRESESFTLWNDAIVRIRISAMVRDAPLQVNQLDVRQASLVIDFVDEPELNTTLDFVSFESSLGSFASVLAMNLPERLTLVRNVDLNRIFGTVESLGEN